MRPLRHRVADAIGNHKARRGKSNLKLADAAIGVLGFTREDVDLLCWARTKLCAYTNKPHDWTDLDHLADRIEEMLPPAEGSRMKRVIEVARSLDRSREDNVRSAAKEGKVNIRERRNKEPCPNCDGKHNEVYQYVKEYREEANLYDHDDRWFCFCGYTEVPGKESKGWRNP